MILRGPPEALARSRRRADAAANVAGTKQRSIFLDVVLRGQTERLEDLVDERRQRLGLTGADHVVRRFVLLNHAPHGLDVLGRPSPVALHREIAEPQALAAPGGDATGRRDDLLGDEPLGSKRRLVVEQDPRAGVEIVGLSIAAHLPEGRRLRDGVGAARPKRGVFVRRDAHRVAEAFARAGVVEADRALQQPDRLEQIERGVRDALQRLGRLLERQPHRGLTRQVVDLVRLDLQQHADEAAKVGERRRRHLDAIADSKPGQVGERRHRRISRRPDHLVAAVEQQLRQVSRVLARDSADERGLGGSRDSFETQRSEESGPGTPGK